MWAVKTLYIFLNIVIRLLPNMVDPVIQIWNGVVIDQMVKDRIISYPGPLLLEIEREGIFIEQDFEGSTEEILEQDRDYVDGSTVGILPQRRKRSIPVAPSVLKITLTDELSFQVTPEGFVSVGLVQLPALCLAVFGIVQAFRNAGFSSQAAKDSLHASVLIFLPFFLVEIVSFFEFFCSSLFNTSLGLICGQCTKECVKKFDFLHFLGKKDHTGKAKLLSLDAAQVFFGSCIQLCLQIVLLQYSFVSNPSQLLSIISSFFMVTKTVFEISSYKRNEETLKTSDEITSNEEVSQQETSNEDKSNDKMSKKSHMKKHLKSFLVQVLNTIWEFIKWLPLLWSSLLFNLGTLTLSILLLGWYAVLIIACIILVNLFTAWAASLERVQKIAEKYQMTHQYIDLATGAKSGHSILTKLLMSYTNIFIISRPVEDLKHFSVNLMFLLQPLHLFVNFVCLCVFLGLGSTFFFPQHVYSFNYVPNCYWQQNCPIIMEHFSLIIVVFLCAGVLNIFLCFTDFQCKVSDRDIAEKDEVVELTAIMKDDLTTQSCDGTKYIAEMDEVVALTDIRKDVLRTQPCDGTNYIAVHTFHTTTTTSSTIH